MASSDDKFTFEIVYGNVLHFGNRLNEKLCNRFIFTRSLGKVWLEILVANLATNFQELAAKVKNLVALASVLGTILRPVNPLTPASNCPRPAPNFRAFFGIFQSERKHKNKPYAE